jgi:gliding motility-associated-like protein
METRKNNICDSFSSIYWRVVVSVVFFISIIPSFTNYGFAQQSAATTFNEKQARETLKQEGLSQAAIDQWVTEQKKINGNSQSSTPQTQTKKNPSVNATGTCSGMGGEGGWGVWEAATGNNNYLNTPSITWNATGLVPSAPRFTIVSGNGIDPCTPGINPGDPPIPFVAPGFGNASIQLGQTATNGSTGGCNYGCVEQLTYNLLVTPQDTNFVYAYAIILENPSTGHTKSAAPYAEIYILDKNNDTVACSHHKYMGDTTGGVPPGMYRAACTSPAGYGLDVAYQPWTTFGICLTSYIGQTVKVVITNVDCGQGGHYCYSYWDFMCPSISSSLIPFCAGQQTTIVGPPSIPGVPFSYVWYQNHQPYTGLPNATSQSITPTPQPGDTFVVHILEPSGCNFWMPFAPEATTIIPKFSYSSGCGKMNFTDSSSVLPFSPTNTVTAWNWSFPGGTPSFASTQNPGTILYPPGTYTATLIVTSTAGCTDTVQQSFTVGGFPVAAFTSVPPCLGSAVTLSDGSLPVQGDPIVSWNWTMNGANPSTSTAQNPSATYSIGGTHIVSLIVITQAGCKDTIAQQVLVYNPPLANFSGSGTGCAPLCVNNFTDLSTSSDGNIILWAWSFPGGSPSSSTVQNPSSVCYNSPGSYGASLIVTTNYGCKDTLKITPLVNVYPWPHADFCVAPDLAPATNPVFSFCDMWSPNPGVTNWIWNFGDGSDLDSTSTDPVHSYSATASGNDFYSYNVCLKVKNQYGCWDTACKSVELVPEFVFYIPNTFTPNDDRINDRFFGKGRGIKEYNIEIFDRWGNMLWDCSHEGKNTDWDSNGQDGMSSACKWDGVVQQGGLDQSGNSGAISQQDVYIWKVKLTDIFNKKHTYVGHVNIVR